MVSKKTALAISGIVVLAALAITAIVLISVMVKRKQTMMFGQSLLSNKFKPLKYAFVYVGQLRTWRKAVPTWSKQFEQYKPDVYLFLNPEPKQKVPTLEEYEKVFGPNVKIKAIHYWSKKDNTKFMNEVKPKAKPMVEFIRDKLKDVKIVQDATADISAFEKMPIQFAQVQKAFRMYDFRKKYDIVVKSRMDASPIDTFNIHPPWNSVETVLPHIKKLWQEHPNYQDSIVDGRVMSYSTFNDGYTLGGAYIKNDDNYVKNVDDKKVIWMANDFVYWGSSENMHTLNSDIFDKYGNYLSEEIPYCWAPEGNLILHAKSHGLQPLMSIQFIYVLRN